MREPSEADRNAAEELLDAWERGGNGYADLAERIAVALADAKADTRVAAEELRAAAKDVSWPIVNATFFRRVLRARADALDADA